MPTDEYIKRSDARAYVRHAHGKGLNLMESIDAIPAADVEPRRRWIPVTERLPENGKYVLAYSADDDYTTVEARHKFEVFQITHWMPLPEPPKEEDDGGGRRWQ